MTDTRRYMITDDAMLERADNTFTRRAAAIEETEEALQLIRKVEETLRDAAGYLKAEDPLINRILSYPMSWDALAGNLREDIAEWKRDQDDLEREIERYNSAHFETLDSTDDN